MGIMPLLRLPSAPHARTPQHQGATGADSTATTLAPPHASTRPFARDCSTNTTEPITTTTTTTLETTTTTTTTLATTTTSAQFTPSEALALQTLTLTTVRAMSIWVTLPMMTLSCLEALALPQTAQTTVLLSSNKQL